MERQIKPNQFEMRAKTQIPVETSFKVCDQWINKNTNLSNVSVSLAQLKGFAKQNSNSNLTFILHFAI